MGIHNEHGPRGDTMLQVSVAASVLTGLAVALRFVARLRSKMSFGIDDWFIAGSLVLRNDCSEQITWVQKSQHLRIEHEDYQDQSTMQASGSLY